MINQMTIDGVKAVISYDPEIELFRGEFIGLNGGADFYASDIEGLKREGAISLKVFLDACKEDEVEPFKSYSGKFVVRAREIQHREFVAAAAAEGKSLNQWIVEKLEQSIGPPNAV